MSNYASMSAGLPYTYTNTPMYWQYIQQLQQQQQQQMQQLQQQQQQQQQQMVQQQLQQQMQSQQVQQAGDSYAAQGTQQAVSVQAPQQTQQSAVEDGNDDGKISFWSKVKNVGKGVVNFFKGMVCDENGFSIKRTLTTVGVAAAGVALTVATGGAAAPYLVAAGVAMGTFEVGKGAYKACTATTDAEAELAWQEIGSGATGLGLSIAGAKGALKSAGVDTTNMNCLQATGKCLQISGKGVYNGGIELVTHPFRSSRAVVNYYKNTVKPNWENTFSYKHGAKNYAEATENNLKQQVDALQEQMDALRTSDPASPEINRLQAEIDQLNIRREINATSQELREINTQRISEINTELNKPGITASEKTALEAERLELFTKLSEQVRNNDAYIERLDNIINQCREDLKTATGDGKAIIQQRLNYLEAYKQEWSSKTSMYKIDTAQANINKAQMHIDKLNIDLKNAATDAERARITSRIEAITNAIDVDKQILRNQNMLISARNTLPNVGMAIGAQYLGGMNFADNLSRDLELSMEQYYNQAMAQQQSYEQAMQQANGLTTGSTTQQVAQNTQATQQTSQQSGQTTPQNTGMTQPMNFGSQSFLPAFMPRGTGLDFNSLYVSPFPDVI